MLKERLNLVGKGPIYDAVVDKIREDVVLSKHPVDAALLICIGYPWTIRKETIAKYKYGVINVHTSLLPKYRGRHPVDWAMENQEREVGITVHYIQDETIDTGDIILQDSVSYVVGEGYDSLIAKLAKKAPRITAIAILQILDGLAYRRKQNEEVASYYPKRTKPRIFKV